MFRKFFLWWFGQLAELVAGPLRGGDAANRDALVIIPAGPLSRTTDHLDVSLRRNLQIHARLQALARSGIAPQPNPAASRLDAGFEVYGFRRRQDSVAMSK